MPDVAPMPPILPLKREWRQAVLEATEASGPRTATSEQEEALPANGY
jgi:hypothetical protein